VSTTLATITKSLKKGDAVTLVGFGTFKTAVRKARKGRNPLTGGRHPDSPAQDGSLQRRQGAQDHAELVSAILFVRPAVENR
jgi:hypothetical protein